jgi:hypothetical protein
VIHEPLADADLSKVKKLRPHELAIRFAFGAVISLVAGVVALVFGPKAGGLFLAFPAILPATLTLIEKKEGIREAVHNVEGAVFGALGMIAFAITVTWTIARTTLALSLALGLAVWIAVSMGSYLVYHLTGERV